MSGAAASGGGLTAVVRPFEARVVRQEWAAQAVTPMVDALSPGEHRSPAHTPADAYDEVAPALYVYRMRRGSEHLGVVADVRLEAFASGAVRGHESVDPHRVDALVRYYAEHPTRSEPVALLHDHPPGTTTRVETACRGRPLLHFQSPDGLEHTVWRVSGDEETAGIAEALAQGIHYIADGHHRVAARLRAWEQAGRPVDAGVLCVIYPLDGLTMSAFHRRVTGPLDTARLLDALAEHFVVRRATAGSATDGLGVFVAGCWYDVAPVAARPEGVAGLDASVLESRILGPVLGITGPGHPRLEVVPDHVPLPHLTAKCQDDGGALFVVRPPSLRTLTRIADLGEQMPPKTTYFAPKPYAGIFLT
jgi:uncharacterized protein (DUF1015 family)